MSIGGYVDSAFKEMARYQGFANDIGCSKIRKILQESESNIQAGKAPKTVPINLCLSVFEKIYEISHREVVIKTLPKSTNIVRPFEPYHPKTKAPIWWIAYNELKHDIGAKYLEATPRITYEALAGAFLLNAIHFPSAIRLYNYDILKIQIPFRSEPSKYSMTQISCDTFQDILKSGQGFSGFAESPLFKYFYSQ